MRIYVPDKRETIINEVLKDLYLLRQEVDYGAGTPTSKLQILDRIRNKLQKILEEE